DGSDGRWVVLWACFSSGFEFCTRSWVRESGFLLGSGFSSVSSVRPVAFFLGSPVGFSVAWVGSGRSEVSAFSGGLVESVLGRSDRWLGGVPAPAGRSCLSESGFNPLRCCLFSGELGSAVLDVCWSLALGSPGFLVCWSLALGSPALPVCCSL